MMKARLRELGIETAARLPPRLLDEDLVWRPSAADWQLVHEDVSWGCAPVCLMRSQYLQHRQESRSSLTVRLSFCCDGCADALRLLERYASSFERVVPPNSVVNVADEWTLGDFGLGWSWSRSPDVPDVLAFRRHNLLAVLEGRDAARHVLPVARALDGALRRLRTVGAYPEDGAGADQPGRPGPVRVAAHGELDLTPILGEDSATSCFFREGGRAVLDRRARRWEFRAGGERGRVHLPMFRAGAGIVPQRESLIIEVV